MRDSLILDNFFIFDFDLKGEEKFDIENNKISLCLAKKTDRELELIKNKYLHLEELSKLSKYTYTLKRRSFLLGRIVVKKLIAHHINNNSYSKDIKINNTIEGEPFIEGSNFNISIAHSDDLGAAVISPPCIKATIDIEYTAHLQKIDSSSFSNSDLYMFQSILQQEAYVIQTCLWASKEALVKFLGIGFTIPFDLLDLEKVVNYDTDIFFIYFKNFKSVKVVVIKEKGIILAICLSKPINITNLREFAILFRFYINQIFIE
ncbi:4'-phosphopantetheinyl transferase family protein [Candidatus Cardinium hertigii]|uniref:4'-phosphopantetheinyl transferase superfamily protein n=1 Tax=Candidatus Cardinium hertigii TaxID=247481 RepID=A0A2Z3LG60_9BACT|nr:hypothetical protein [Candidatus Cardinium hertigii]AWN81555.1 hypothetical protein DK880_00223 [Candidatus Cardinium hertigii]